MIQINSVIGKVIQHKYCSTIIVSNYNLCPVGFLELIAKLSFVINTIDYYPDMIVVISNDNLDEFVYQLAKISSFCKIEQGA